MFSTKDYYALARKLNEIDQVQVDNDMLLFSQDIYRKMRKQCIPTDETYHDYYYHYLGMDKRLTLHDEFVNKLEFEGEYNRRGLRRKSTTFGLSGRGTSSDLNQPIFNDQFLNEISKKGYLTIYSNRK